MEEIKICDYCTPNKKNVYGDATGKNIDGLGSSSGMWFYMTNGMYILRSHGSKGYNEIKPIFCPMCGARL